jgi:glycosyltransferase involved in cell wall biosynthesis
MGRPLVSVSVITYNHAKFIGPAIESALEQSWRPLQVVVADDGSSDGTAEIVAEYARRYPNEVVAITGRVGLLENCNRSLRACTGEFIAKLDGDDLFLPGKLERQVAWFLERPERVLCGHDVEHFESDGSQPSFTHFSRSRPFAGVGPGPFLENGSPFATVSIMVRRSVVPTTGFDRRMQAATDYKFWLDCLAGGGEFGYLPEVLARYRRHSMGFQRTREHDIRADALCARTIFELEHPEYARSCRIGRARSLYAWAMVDFERGDVARARAGLRAALAEAPLAVPRAPAALALLQLPEPAREKILGLRSKLRGLTQELRLRQPTNLRG